MQGRYVALSALMLAVGVGGGLAVERFYLSEASGAGGSGPEILYWVAPMDPNFRKDGPGQSPMGMDLVPVFAGDEPTGDPEEVHLTAQEINAIGVRTTVARIEPIASRIETVGFVGYDEHATSHIHMRVVGWIEQLEVRAVGDRVSQGDLLFELYAPEITIASSELVRGVRRGDESEIAVARRKLRNFGVSDRQIEEMAEAVEPAEYIRVYAPQDGVVVALEGAEGMYLKPDIRAMTLTDLSTVWLVVDVFERDIGRLTEGMTATARFEHLPNRIFEGAVDYIYPELDATTRTLPVRLRFDNAEGVLRPNMFGTVTLEAPVVREGVTVASEAVIRTGRAERVILRTGDGVFRPRFVTTGLRDGFGAGGRTEIVQGLAPGEEVVASAQFLIDSESALTAGLLRMAPTDAEPARGSGVLVALDPERRTARLRHEPIPALDWPEMTTEFAVATGVDVARLELNSEVKFSAVRGADGLLALTDLRLSNGVDAVGTGVAHAVTEDGKVSLSHDPIPDLGWPAMTMELPLEGVDPDAVPLDAPIEFDLAKGDGGLFLVVGVRAAGEASGEKLADAEDEAPAVAPDIIVAGVIEAINEEARTAQIAHGPIAEIGMPGMTIAFQISDAIDPAILQIGVESELTFARPDGMTMVLTAAEPAPAVPLMAAEGQINAVDAGARMANVTHGPLREIGMPGMTMDFPLGQDLDAAALRPGAATLGIRMTEAGGLELAQVEMMEPPLRVDGVIESVDTKARKAMIAHGPIREIGMPGMTMGFAIGSSLTPADLPLGENLTLLFAKGDDFSLTLVGLEPGGGQ